MSLLTWMALLAVAPAPTSRDAAAYATMVRRVAAMTEDRRAAALVERRRLALVDLTWEDTGRWEGSSLGPNISDVTIEVEMVVGGRKRTALMPVIRSPNFTDVTGDVAIDRIRIPVGNQAPGWTVGQPLQHITLREFLAEPARYLSTPGAGTIKGGSLLARRDTHVLVSAQASFLPVSREGAATFWPVIFNYQSSRKNPAVLTLLVTRQGTSATIIDNSRDSPGAESWGQRMFFNTGGDRAPLTAERLSVVSQNGVTSNGEAAASLGEDANLLMLVQIPLRQRRERFGLSAVGYGSGGGAFAGVASGGPREASAGPPEVETAVLGHGPKLGPYTELDGLTIERDPRFPVRLTVQFYQATSRGVLSDGIVRTLARQLRHLYRDADYLGSLVTPPPDAPARVTAWDGISARPPGVTWQDFPGLVERVGDFGVPWRPGWPPGPWRLPAPPP
jgi:hypothetical protein